MIAGGVMILRIDQASLLTWAVALAVVALMAWRPRLHPMILLAGGAAIFVVGRVFGGA
jgi:chromate transporter